MKQRGKKVMKRRIDGSLAGTADMSLERKANMPLKRKIDISLISYEIRNVLGDFFVPFFGIVFPVLMLILITKAVAADVSAKYVPEANTSVFIMMSMLIPMAVGLLGYASVYSKELEKDIPLRMRLFGIPEKALFESKVIAQLIVITTGLVLYTAVGYASLDLLVPDVKAAASLVICLYILGLIFLIFSHSIATLTGKFGPTYAITMTLYFLSMMLSGMMGIKNDQLPGALKSVASLLPMSYISNDFIDFWKEGSYNYMPLLQAFLFTGAVAGILLIFARRKTKAYRS